MTATRFLLPLALLVALLLGGCISVGIGGSEPTPEIRFHVLASPATTARTKELWPISIAVRGLDVRGRYEVRVVESDGADTLRFREFERWADEPDEALTVAVRESLVAQGNFRAVLSAGSGLRADLELSGQVLAFDMVRPAEGPLRARFVARLVLSDGRSGELKRVVSVRGEQPLAGRDAAGLGTAMAAAVDQAVQELLRNWKTSGALK